MEIIVQQQQFTCIGKGHGAPCFPANREEWEKLRREPWLAQMCARIERGDEQLKHRLPVWTPHCAEFRDNHRAIADAVRPLNRLMLDFDEKGHTDDILRSLTIDHSSFFAERSGKAERTIDHSSFFAERSGKAERTIEHSPLTVLLVEESVRRGTHVLVEMPEGMSADEAQQLMKEATGFEPDAAVKDVSRCIYMVPEDHTRYVSDRLFEVSEACELKSQPTSNELKSQPVDAEAVSHGVCPRETSELKSQPSDAEAESGVSDGQGLKSQPSFKGIPYAQIIAEWWHRNGGEPMEGERNVKLHKLAVSLRAICDNRKDVLMQVMPRFGLSDTELKSIVDSACKEPPKGISKMMQVIVKALAPLSSPEGDTTDPESADNSSPLGGLKGGLKALPIGLRESLIGVPESMFMPVLCSVLPICGAYADQVEVEYCDGYRQHLGLMSIIRGDQASGKSVCKNVVDVWKRQLDEEDALARKREEEWKERKKGRKANEKAPDDPHVMIRMVPVTVSCSTLLKRFKNANGHTLYSFGEELDTLRKTNGAGSWSSKYDIYRLSFDNGEWGQDYNSDQAESGVVKVAYNWTMLGTNGALRKCFRQDNIENGLSSRVLVAEMPDSAFQKMPKYGRRSDDDEARIQEAVTRLRSFSGLIDTPRLRKAIEQWVEQKRIEAAKDIDLVKDTYRKRAAVIGFRCGVIFHLLSSSPRLMEAGKGLNRESKACLDFAVMMAEYCLEQQMKAFGEALRNEYTNAQDECQRYGVNCSVFDRLAPTFSRNDLRAMKTGTTESGLRNIIMRWKRDGWIVPIDKDRFQKTAQASEPSSDTAENVPPSHRPTSH